MQSLRDGVNFLETGLEKPTVDFGYKLVRTVGVIYLHCVLKKEKWRDF